MSVQLDFAARNRRMKDPAHMVFSSLTDLLRHLAVKPCDGPVAIIGAEDDVEVASTLRHHIDLGFKTVLALLPDRIEIPKDVETSIIRVNHEITVKQNLPAAVNRIMQVLPEGTWTYCGHNAEYLFYPFCEARSVGELLAFHTEERRKAMLTYVVDLYADDLEQFPDAVSLERAHLDKVGYYALARLGGAHNHPKERQLDFFGGLRWRFEEHVPPERRKIDRIALFRSAKNLVMRNDHTFNEEEMNTYACPWHNNLTAAICSFRTAKALKLNPGSRNNISSFTWHNSEPFQWHSRQLMDLGLMEPGQWF